MLFELLLRRKNKLLIEENFENEKEENEKERVAYIASIMKNIEALGYTFSREVVKVLKTFEVEQLKAFYLKLIPALKKQKGADVSYHPMYPNFPQSVMEEKEATLYINAMIHYWSYGKLYPNIRKEERLPLFEETKVTVLSLGTMDEITEIFQQLVGANTSISKQDQEDLSVMFKRIPNIEKYMPQTIGYKENVAYIGKLYLNYSPLLSAKSLKNYFKTATDVLRLATALSDGDISLAQNCKYISFPRRVRRILLELLEECSCIEEDMYRRKGQFVRLGERLHVGEYAHRYPRAYRAYEKLRNGEKIKTYGGTLAFALEQGNFDLALELLKERPGEFARKLDFLLRSSKEKEEIFSAFEQVAGKVATPVLLQVKEHFLHRNDGELRVYFPKGKLSQAKCIETPLIKIEDPYCHRIVEICENALMEHFEKESPMGKVYVSDAMKNNLVPFNQRTASKGAKVIVPGSHLSIGETTKAIRGCIWWTNDEKGGRVDIDLSAAFFNEKFQCLEHVSYTNLRSRGFRAYHSGDITNGGSVNGDGVSEFLDVDIDRAIANGARYIVYQVYSFTGQSFANLPNVSFGFMERADVKSGEIYEPKTVKQKIQITSSSTVSIPVIFDCAERKIIWCDMNLRIANCSIGGNNVESNLSSVALACYSMVHMHKPTIYDLVQLHIKARGTLCDNKEDADLIFDEEEGITPYDTEIFMSEYLI